MRRRLVMGGVVLVLGTALALAWVAAHRPTMGSLPYVEPWSEVRRIA